MRALTCKEEDLIHREEFHRPEEEIDLILAEIEQGITINELWEEGREAA